ncbi:MAG: twin-arginine translocase subunit TatC [Saprospiraceae bacterium]|nr:twin-arginine translocase subunit TatC [Saprospiraceae bacterium]MDW8483964.1 twin-arginine translocase subunit TatC [Saprospiraceae bacterium]
MPPDPLHKAPAESQGTGEMSFFEHVEELRQRLLRSFVAIGIMGVGCFLSKDLVFDALIFGPRNPDFITYRALCSLSHWAGLYDKMCFKPVEFKLITRQLGEILMQHLYVSFWLGFILAFPYVLWQLWLFLKPGLLESEQKAIRGIVTICSLLFLVGVAFGYFIIAPFSINFLAGYTLPGTEVAPTLSSYVTYMTMFTIPIGLFFELPIVIFFLTKIGVVGYRTLQAYRRYAFVGILIVAAIITPPDVVSQTIVALPLYGLYEISILISRREQRRRERVIFGKSVVVDVVKVRS